jgi:hypothetical protein
MCGNIALHVFILPNVYRVINFRGVLPVYISGVWKHRVPPEFIFRMGAL